MNKSLQASREGESPPDAEFSEHYQEYYDKIKGYIFRFLKDDEMSKDLTQNVFLKLYHNLAKVPKEHLRNWLYKVAHNDSINYLTKSSTKLLSFDDEHVSPTTTANPCNIVQQKDDQRLIHDLLLKLPQNQRTAILLKDVKGYSYEEIARAMGISHGAVKSLIYRGRRSFMKYYKEAEIHEV